MAHGCDDAMMDCEENCEENCEEKIVAREFVDCCKANR
jgi:hypothetical protein